MPYFEHPNAVFCLSVFHEQVLGENTASISRFRTLGSRGKGNFLLLEPQRASNIRFSSKRGFGGGGLHDEVDCDLGSPVLCFHWPIANRRPLAVGVCTRLVDLAELRI